MSPSGIHHLAAIVSDLTRSEHFYCGTLGLSLYRRWPFADGSGHRASWVQISEGTILALELPPQGQAAILAREDDVDVVGWHLLALTIEIGQRDEWRDRLRAAGLEIERESRFSLFFRDPDNNRLALSHYPEAAVAG